MAKVAGNSKIAIEIVEAIGLDPHKTLGLTIDLWANELATVTTMQALYDDQLDAIIEVVKRYNLVAEDICDE